MKNLRIITILLALLLLNSCDTEKRIAKKVNKFGAENVLGWLQKNRKDLFIVQRDTIRDTVVITAIKKDTVVKWSNISVYDTITITKDRLKVKVIKLPGDTVKIEGECAGDTIYINKPCPEVITPKYNYGNYEGKYLFIAFPLVLLLIIALAWIINKKYS